MKTWRVRFGLWCCLLSFFLLSVVAVWAQDFPVKPDRLVNDYTGTLTAGQIQQLENKLVAFDDSSTVQIAVVLVKSTKGYEIADYGVRLAQRWGIGDKKNNSGILLLVAIEDRAVTIQTGYGVEGAVPDAIAYRIIEREIKPPFRAGNYFQGIDQATNALIAYTKGEYKANPKPKANNPGGFPSMLFFVILIAVVIAIVGRNRGGGGGKGGEVFGGKGAADALWWMTMMRGMGNSGRGRGGFGGGGGFGGFGGGGFGGGGASGRW